MFGENFPAGWFQDYDHEFRWSFTGTAVDQIPAQTIIHVHFDQSFINAFGAAGLNVVQQAFNTMSVQSGNALYVAGNRNNQPLPAQNQYDLESVALHEIGHTIGLHHPDEAIAFNRNYQENPPGYPWLNNLAVGAPAGDVMNGSTNVKGAAARDLTQDDFSGVKYLYDPANKNAPVAEEGNVPGGVPGLGKLLFDFDTAAGNDTAASPNVGFNIDVFAKNLMGVAGIVDSQTEMPTDVDPARGTNVRHVRDGFGGDPPLAYADVSFSLNPGTDGPGIINGDRGKRLNAGADIVFNIEPGLSWYPSVPEPASSLLAAIAFLGGAAKRRTYVASSRSRG